MLGFGILGLEVVMILFKIKFDFNKWLEDRRRAKIAARRCKLAKRCKHTWTLYPHSQFSMCNKCLGLISTPLLMDLPDELRPLIRGIMENQSIKARKSNIFVSSPVNDKRLARALLTPQLMRRITETRHDSNSHR